MRSIESTLAGLWLGIALLTACTEPTAFVRDNPNDPGSEAYQVPTPTQLNTTATPNSMRVVWSMNATIPEVALFRRQDGGPWEQIGQFPSTTTLHWDGGISYNRPTDYQYRIVARHEDRESNAITGPIMQIRHAWGWNFNMLTGSQLQMYFNPVLSSISNNPGGDVVLVRKRVDSVRVSRDIGSGYQPAGFRELSTTVFDDAGPESETVRYRFEPWIGGAPVLEPVETRWMDRLKLLNTSDAVETDAGSRFYETLRPHQDRLGERQRWMLLVNGADVRLRGYRNDGTLATDLPLVFAHNWQSTIPVRIRVHPTSPVVALLINNRRLLVYTAAGHVQEVVATQTGLLVGDIAFSEDGNTLYYTEHVASTSRHELWARNLQTETSAARFALPSSAWMIEPDAANNRFLVGLGGGSVPVSWRAYDAGTGAQAYQQDLTFVPGSVTFRTGEAWLFPASTSAGIIRVVPINGDTPSAIPIPDEGFTRIVPGFSPDRMVAWSPSRVTVYETNTTPTLIRTYSYSVPADGWYTEVESNPLRITRFSTTGSYRISGEYRWTLRN